MRNLPTPQATEDIRQWQQFLAQQSVALNIPSPGGADGYFGSKTERATVAFQRACQLKPDGIVGPQTLAEAQKRGLPPNVIAPGARLHRDVFEIGPHRTDDLRECRPYFLVPLDPKFQKQREAILKRIVEAVNRVNEFGRPVTDVYVLSHGWHRNFFGAVSAYDRLVSRYTHLRRRGRLPHPRDDDQTFSPLLITLHWHSDPGEDDWEDPRGRRHKDSFLKNVRDAFEPIAPVSEAEMTEDFENIFELFSRVSAPGVDALSPEFDQRAKDLLLCLNGYRTRNAPDPPSTEPQSVWLSEKAAAAWTCYHEAMARQSLIDQDEKPQRYNTLAQAWLTLFNFVIALVGVAALLGYFPKLWTWFAGLRWVVPVIGWLGRAVHGVWDPIWNFLVAILPLNAPEDGVRSPIGAAGIVAFLLIAVLISLLAWCYLAYAARKQARHNHRSGSHLPLPALAAWLWLFLLCSVPLVAVLLVTFLLGGPLLRAWEWLTKKPVRRVPFLFDERFGTRGRPPDPNQTAEPPSLRYVLAKPARWTLDLLREAVRKDGAASALANALDAQFAFWEMQVKGVATGRAAADFLVELLQAMPALEEANFHLIGHSFGGLVVCNATRHLAYSPFPNAIRTLCLVQAAVGCGWFEAEDQSVGAVQGAIANIYSRYDTANGFYFPVANNSKLAAGNKGLTEAGGVQPEQRCNFASLVAPPDLDSDEFTAYCAPPSGHRPAAGCRVLNLDASRLIYAGPVASGGGHTDIFKDDVVHLIWAATRL